MAVKENIRALKKVKVSSETRTSPPQAVPLKSALKNSGTKTSTSAPKESGKTPSEPKNPRIDKGKAKADAGDAIEPSSTKNAHVSLPSTFKVIAGSYEKLLYGLEGTLTVEEGSATKHRAILKPVFIFSGHNSCVKAVAASPEGGKWLATGSTDEIVKVWDLRRRKEIGGLVQHEGSITYLSFPTRSHLVSASDDGLICVFRARDWVLLRSLKGHKGRINCVAIHPSGKVGLSVGKDKTLRMWDLMRGKGSASTKLGKEGELVRWSVRGDQFVVQSGKTIDIYSTDMSLLKTLTHASRIHDLRFCKSSDDPERELLLVAGEDKKVVIYDTRGGDETSLPILGELLGHQNRVKALDVIAVALPSGPNSPSTTSASTTLISTISSDGWIRIFNLATLPSTPDELTKLDPIGEYNTKGSRLTCVAFAGGEILGDGGSAVKKRKLEDVDDVEDAEDETWGGIASDEE